MTSGIGRRIVARQRRAGFTLLELSVAGGILALIASLCWPALRTFSQSIASRARANRMVHLFYDARETAILSGIPQNITVPDMEDSGAGKPEATFFPDGSARYFHVAYPIGAANRVEVTVEESGQIRLRES